MSAPESAISESGLKPDAYHRYSRWLHWAIAFLMLFMIFLGWRLEEVDSLRRARYDLHKSTGILVLLLSFVRLGLRFAYKAPPELPMPKWQALASKSLHVGFYVMMIALPLSGWLLVSTSVRPIPFFGLFEIPHLPVPQGEPAHGVLEELHHLLAKLIIYVMVPLHVAAALKHHFIDKDSVMHRMVTDLTPKPVLNWRWIVPVGVIVAAVGLGFGILRGVPLPEPTAPPPEAETTMNATSASLETSEPSTSVETSASASEAAPVTRWTLDKTATKITFSTTFQGEPINGAFADYAAQITFDPEQLDLSRVKVTIDLASVTSGNSDYDGSLKGSDFFNTTATPKAVFEARSFTKTGTNRYVAKGKLTLRGVTKPHSLPFTLTIKDGVADMTANTTLDRTAYGVGQGEYAATDAIPAQVAVAIRLRARALTPAQKPS